MIDTPRIGMGVDAHRFAVGRPLRLGGVEVPHHEGLAGHSDGDAATHALCDAMLGAAGLGDLGRHFPSSDERWRAISSLVLLERCVQLAAAAGLVLASAQVVIIAERPRLTDHLAAMEHALGAAAGTEVHSIAVSATTTDGMGYTGRGEGIAATAVALLMTRSTPKTA